MTPFKVAIYATHRHDYMLVQLKARKIAPLSSNIPHFLMIFTKPQILIS